MLTIRLTRKGKKNQPFFKVVVIDKRRSSKGGRAVEDVGYVNPLTKKRSFEKERILYWISKGAKPTASIHNLLVSDKIIEGEKIHVSGPSKKAREAAKVAATAAAAAAKASAPTSASAPVSSGETKPAAQAPVVEAAKETPKA